MTRSAAVKLAGDVECEAIPAVLIKDGEDAQLAAVVGAITAGVPAPHVLDVLGARRDGARGATSSSRTLGPPPDTQAVLAPRIRCTRLRPTCQPSRRRRRTPLALTQARMLVGKHLDLSVQAQQPVRGLLGDVAVAGTMQPQVPARPSLRARSGWHHALDGSPLVRRAPPFFCVHLLQAPDLLTGCQRASS